MSGTRAQPVVHRSNIEMPLKTTLHHTSAFYSEFDGSCSRRVVGVADNNNNKKSHWSVLWLINPALMVTNVTRLNDYQLLLFLRWNRCSCEKQDWKEDDDNSERKMPRAKVYRRLKGEKIPNISQNTKTWKCWISTVIIWLFFQPWDPLGWVTGPMFFSLAGCPASPSSPFATIFRRSQSNSRFLHKWRGWKMSDRQKEGQHCQTLRRSTVRTHRPSAGFLFFSISQLERLCCLLQIRSCDTSTAPAPATELNVCSRNGKTSVYFHSLRHRCRDQKHLP